ncbi:hypothetical protein A2Z67_05035 [Candidatus Woesebacteria bacterium RBG_13_36_22]|uniref:Uncharacterized protein n=1 Tax=Candidatus Woesebacteria bacterium RBG_13_36_22 TaxID=1802478 RepID=A0A1F7X2H1_9BACT|nr:MAG: hypothetical protein A2Z67_05035 [Candidatus Woesebacteria bacterium RBG_13_36_22]
MKRFNVSEDFWDLGKLEMGTIVYDVTDIEAFGSFRSIIMRGPMAWCCYIGIPLDHSLANKSYEDDIFNPFHCHGGLTFAGGGDDVYLPSGWFFYGWDYGHAGDYAHYGSSSRASGKKWTFGELKKEIKESLKDFRDVIGKYIVLDGPKPILKRDYKKKRLIRIDKA